MNLNFEVLIFLPITLVDRQNTTERQMIKVLARLEQLCGQRKVVKFKCEDFTKFCAGLHEILAYPSSTSHLLSFVSVLYSTVELILL